MRERERRVALNTGFDDLGSFLDIKNKSDKPRILRDALASLKQMALINAQLQAAITGAGLASMNQTTTPVAGAPRRLQPYGAKPAKRRQIAPATTNQQVTVQPTSMPSTMPNFGMLMPCLIPFNMPPFAAPAPSSDVNKPSATPSAVASVPPAGMPANMPQGFAGLVQFAAATRAAAATQAAATMNETSSANNSGSIAAVAQPQVGQSELVAGGGGGTASVGAGVIAGSGEVAGLGASSTEPAVIISRCA